MDLVRSTLQDHETLRWLAVLVVLVVTAVVARFTDRRLSARVIERASLRTHALEGELVRAKRIRTAATLVASVGRYGIVVFGVVIAIGVASHGSLESQVGATVLIIIIAFVLQRTIVDMISGALLLFEGEIAVGDYVKTSQLDGISGTVERVGLRSTTLRSFNGDRHVVLNGALQGFTRVHQGFCDFELELFTVNDPDVVEAVGHVCERLRRFDQNFFLRGPDVVEIRQVGTRDVAHVRVRAIVPPTLEWMCEQTLPDQLAAELGDGLIGGVQVFNLDETSFAQYRAAVVLPHVDERPRARDTRRVEESLSIDAPTGWLRGVTARRPRRRSPLR